MYKKQVKLQRIFCLMAIIASALVFAYSLGLVTDLYDSLYTTMYNPKDHMDTAVTGSVIFYDIQPFNNQLMLAGLGLIILSMGLFLTNTHVRRRYYIGNYVATGVWSVAALAVTIWSHIQVSAFKSQFLFGGGKYPVFIDGVQQFTEDGRAILGPHPAVDMTALKAYAEKNNSFCSDSTFWFDAHYVVLGILLLTAIILVANVFWKQKLMKEEAALLAGSASKATSGAAAKAQ